MIGIAEDKRDFFVSFNQADRAWATWIAWVLEEAGYSVFFQDWDFRGNFVLYSDRQKTRKKQTDDGGSGGRLNPSRFLFRLAFLSWPLVPVRRIALFLQDS